MLKPGLNPRLQIIVRKKIHKGGRGRGVAVRHIDAQGGQMAEHLAERGIFAADLCHIAHVELLQGFNVLIGYRFVHWIIPVSRRRASASPSP